MTQWDTGNVTEVGSLGSILSRVIPMTCSIHCESFVAWFTGQSKRIRAPADQWWSRASSEIVSGDQRRHFANPFLGCWRCDAKEYSQNAIPFFRAQPADIFGEGKMIVAWCYTKQLNIVFENFGGNSPVVPPLVVEKILHVTQTVTKNALRWQQFFFTHAFFTQYETTWLTAIKLRGLPLSNYVALSLYGYAVKDQ